MKLSLNAVIHSSTGDTMSPIFDHNDASQQAMVVASDDEMSDRSAEVREKDETTQTYAAAAAANLDKKSGKTETELENEKIRHRVSS